MKRGLSRFELLAAAAFIAAYFLYFTAGSLRAEFTYDDLMNCYRGWFRSFPDLAADNLLFFRFSPTFRPFGALVYKLFFGLFGFDLLPLRALLWILLAGNVFLTYKLASTLTGSAEMGLFAALSLAYHMKFWALYYTTGTLYDIFCFTFYLAALIVYVGIRRQGRVPNWPNLLAIGFLYLLALDSKELAVSFPAMIVVYELLWHPPARTKQALIRWLSRGMTTAWLTAGMTVAYLAGRVFYPGLGIASSGGYRIAAGVPQYLSKMAFYLGELFYAPFWFDSAKAAAVLLLVLLIGVVTRSRVALFGTLLFMVGVLPVAFISERVLSAVYLPLVGLSLCAAVLLSLACGALRRLSRRPAWGLAAFLIVFLSAGAFLARVHPTVEHVYVALGAEYARVRQTREQLQQIHPAMPSDSHILILETPFPQYSPGYQTLFLIRLLYRDESLQVDELSRLQENGLRPVLVDYDCILSYEKGRLVEVDPATLDFGPS